MSEKNILQKVYKFEVPIEEDGFMIRVPEGASLLQYLPILNKGIIKVWFLANPNNPLVERIFNVKKTEVIEDENSR